MILVDPEYLPSVNYFKKFQNKEIIVNTEQKYKRQFYLNQSNIRGNKGIFQIEVPILVKPSTCYLKDIKINYKKNWINSHKQAIQSSYGKYPFYLYYKDIIIEKINARHNFIIDLNYDLLTLFNKILNFENSIHKISEKWIKNKENKDYKLNHNNIDNKKNKDIRDNLFNGKKFDYNISIIDLLFMKGPESGYFINNF